MDDETPDPQAVLARVFGFPSWRGLQAEIVSHAMAGGDALVLMPTGGGKSLCYQVPALCRPGTGIVVSPLISLMDDQVAAMRQLGVSAGALHSELEAEEASRVGTALDRGQLDLLYVSPERLLTGGLIDRLRRRRVALVAIDEAHCVSAWGHEFRPEYRALARLGSAFPGVPRLALTATADPRTRDDILAALGMDEARVFAASFHRGNLDLAAEPKVGEWQQITGFLRRHAGEAGILYCGSRSKTERLAAKLAANGVSAVAYHAGLAPIEKRAALARFRAGEPIAVVATIAFGMGIDRPDVRYVLHADMPDSPEAYYQQVGRAGRDGLPASALLLYGGEDIARARHWLGQSQAPEAQQRVMSQRLEAMIGVAESTACRTRALLACFGEAIEPCGHCDACRRPLTTFDGTEAARKALSAVYRTGQIFGARHLVQVLRGERTAAVEKHGHDRLALFGIGREQPEGYWRGVVRQLIAQGALRTRPGEYASLELVEEHARPILRGERTVLLREDAPPDLGPRRVRGAAETPAAAPNAAADPRFEALRAWRLAAARAQGVPPYVIFHDSTLHEIVAAAPETPEALGQVRGVGASKLARYGAEVLAALRGG